MSHDHERLTQAQHRMLRVCVRTGSVFADQILLDRGEKQHALSSWWAAHAEMYEPLSWEDKPPVDRLLLGRVLCTVVVPHVADLYAGNLVADVSTARNFSILHAVAQSAFAPVAAIARLGRVYSIGTLRVMSKAATDVDTFGLCMVLQHAAWFGNTAFVDEYVTLCYSGLYRASLDGLCLMHWAVCGRVVEMVRLLAALGVRSDVLDATGRTAGSYASDDERDLYLQAMRVEDNQDGSGDDEVDVSFLDDGEGEDDEEDG